jgi:hypothetical protein
MSRMKVTKSYEYNVLCPVCQFKMKASDLRWRWDGLWVCKEDWEPRHPLDFYTARNDVHPLPFIYPDNNGIDVSPIPNTSSTTQPPFRRDKVANQIWDSGWYGLEGQGKIKQVQVR